ncbi:hypothetical protein Bpfe_003509 [Biomphalaria pfeifferi]|uniref:Uncharacterized protein n=1 Tax=Biomphalaria pfeifferi TaxID=112525 RepID=A0AAD8C738_BIOPF|nr:hypothetical protein Bpfe_003509 [Biomphalaria pfeifferi]
MEFKYRYLLIVMFLGFGDSFQLVTVENEDHDTCLGMLTAENVNVKIVANLTGLLRTIELFIEDNFKKVDRLCVIKAKKEDRVKNCYLHNVTEEVCHLSVILPDTELHGKKWLRACFYFNNGTKFCSDRKLLPQVYEPKVHLNINGMEIYNISNETIVSVSVKGYLLNLTYFTENELNSNSSQLVLSFGNETMKDYPAVTFQKQFKDVLEMPLTATIFLCNKMFHTITLTLKFDDPKIPPIIEARVTLIICLSIVVVIIVIGVVVVIWKLKTKKKSMPGYNYIKNRDEQLRAFR